MLCGGPLGSALLQGMLRSSARRKDRLSPQRCPYRRYEARVEVEEMPNPVRVLLCSVDAVVLERGCQPAPALVVRLRRTDNLWHENAWDLRVIRHLTFNSRTRNESRSQSMSVCPTPLRAPNVALSYSTGASLSANLVASYVRRVWCYRPKSCICCSKGKSARPRLPNRGRETKAPFSEH